ncbi:hypothetical protein AVEN_19633-1 [Araneus ventricosus]|uniref:Uncharacterized protein n=1 Tax=Araneus ventricosus TaxID=182803 RepID=A0A4Y2C258_ARAVE|nr:hypothetical protein AVEN_19633-1 [Araneus ventricosus]
MQPRNDEKKDKMKQKKKEHNGKKGIDSQSRPSRLLSPLITGGRKPKEKRKNTMQFFPVSDTNTKEKSIAVRIMEIKSQDMKEFLLSPYQ